MSIKTIALIVLFILLASFAMLVMRGSRSHIILESKQIALKESSLSENSNKSGQGKKAATQKNILLEATGSQSVNHNPELLSKVPGEYIEILSKTNF